MSQDKPTAAEEAEAEKLKDLGNDLFKKGALKDAIVAYSRALAACRHSNATYYSNRYHIIMDAMAASAFHIPNLTVHALDLEQISLLHVLKGLRGGLGRRRGLQEATADLGKGLLPPRRRSLGLESV